MLSHHTEGVHRMHHVPCKYVHVQTMQLHFTNGVHRLHHMHCWKLCIYTVHIKLANSMHTMHCMHSWPICSINMQPDLRLHLPCMSSRDLLCQQQFT